VRYRLQKQGREARRAAGESGSSRCPYVCWPATMASRKPPSGGRAGRIRTGDPLTPRNMRYAPPAKTATAGA